jgi:hypothetical protein
MGSTGSSNFAGANNSSHGDDEVFVAKVTTDGALAWATYLGGSGSDGGRAIAVDAAENALVTGLTFSSDFAGANNSYHGGQDAYVAKISLADTSAAPTGVDLVAASDTGVSSSDDLTNLDNSTSGKTLQFEVSGTISGATVTVYADGTVIGSATAVGASATVTTNGTSDLADDSRSITARQTEPGKEESADCPALSICVDTAALHPPCLPASSEDLLILLAKRAERTLTTRGIELGGMFYTSDELMALRAEMAAGNNQVDRLSVRYNPWDLGAVWVVSPIGGSFLEAPAIDSVMRGTTEYQWRGLKRAVRERFDQPRHLLVNRSPFFRVGGVPFCLPWARQAMSAFVPRKHAFSRSEKRLSRSFLVLHRLTVRATLDKAPTQPPACRASARRPDSMARGPAHPPAGSRPKTGLSPSGRRKTDWRQPREPTPPRSNLPHQVAQFPAAWQGGAGRFSPKSERSVNGEAARKRF